MAIINNNVGNVKFLRNGTVFNSHELAYNALTGFTLTDEQDGTAILARYTAEDTKVKTLVGWVYKNGNTEYITIQDIEGASQDVLEYLGSGVTKNNNATMQLEALSGTAQDTSASTSVAGAKVYAKDYTDEQIGELEYTGVTTGTGVYVTNVTESDGVVSATTATLPTVAAISEAGKPIIAVSEDKGTISASAGTIDAEYVDVTGFTATDVQGALEEVKDAIGTAISGLDASDTAEAKKFVTSVSEEDGIITVSRGEITSSAETIVLTDNSDGGVNFEVNIDNDTIVQDSTSKKLKVASAALTQYVGDEKTIHISSADTTTHTKTVSSLLTISATTPTGTNVKEQYNLVNASGQTIGDTIKIYKDSSLYSAYLGHTDDTIAGDPPVVTSGTGDTALCFIYHKEDGSYELVAVNVESFLEESEFASGVTADSSTHIVHGVVDSNSEKDSQSTPADFLTVGADGFKISGIKDEIDRRVGNIVDDLDATVSNSGTSGHVGVEVVEEDGKLTTITVSENDIASQTKLDELSGKTITEVESSNSSISAVTAATTDGTVKVDLTTDASKIKMTGFTADASGFTAITTASTVTEAVKAIETEIIANEQTTSAALNDLNTKISGVSGDVATLSGQVQTISGKVDTIEAGYVSGVTVNGTSVVTDKVGAISISGGTSAATSANAVVVETDSTTGAITISLGTIDCGTY